MVVVLFDDRGNDRRRRPWASTAVGSTTWLMRFTDLFLAIPFLIGAILLSQLPSTQAWARTIMGPAQSVRAVIFVIGIFFWMPVARIIRGLVLSLKEKEFVEAAPCRGRVRFPDHVPAPRTELHRSDHHQHDARSRGGDPDGVGTLVPRIRRRGDLHADVGQPAQQLARLARLVSLPRVGTRARDRDHGAVRQLHRRRPARRALDPKQLSV